MSDQQLSFRLSFLVVAVAPAYLFLSLVAIISRSVSFLGILASHGKSYKISMQWRCINVPKRYFSHFYVASIVSFLAFRYAMIDPATRSGRPPWTQLLVLLHLSRRIYECIRVHKFLQKSQMHLAGYLLGIGHYVILPVVFLGRSAPHPNRSWWWLSLFCCCSNGWMQYEQHIHHNILATMRLGAKDRPAYSLPPNQRWFRWSLCPHYLAEILIYASWSILLTQEKSLPLAKFDWLANTSPSINRLLRTAAEQRHWYLLLWVATNLTVSAFNNRDWYRQHYPSLTKAALFPL